MRDGRSGAAGLIEAELEESIAVKRRVVAEQVPVIEKIAGCLLEALRREKKILLFGNGGSAADSQHLAAEFVSRFRRQRQALRALALTTDTSILTSIGNDDTFDRIFARQIEALGDPGDIAIGISTSGHSRNVLLAMRTARERDMLRIGFTGATGGALVGEVDHCFCVPSENTARIQEAHIAVGHILCEMVERVYC